jgi:cell division protein YceG involved in septum cleavage
MSQVSYKANLDKFLDSLTPEQMLFLGSLIERDIEAKDFIQLDILASLMFERIKEIDVDELHEKTHKKFSDIVIV